MAVERRTHYKIKVKNAKRPSSVTEDMPLHKRIRQQQQQQQCEGDTVKYSTKPPDTGNHGKKNCYTNVKVYIIFIKNVHSFEVDLRFFFIAEKNEEKK